jgi:hypothetical protein
MYDIGIVVPAKLSLTWDAVIGLITLLATFWGVYKIIGSKVSKKRYYEDLKDLRQELKDLEIKIREEMDCIELNNKGSHGKLSAESEKYFQILKDQMATTFTSVEKKIDILLEHALNSQK